jgi:uncharacterized LabA/DUF88 family protein
MTCQRGQLLRIFCYRMMTNAHAATIWARGSDDLLHLLHVVVVVEEEMIERSRRVVLLIDYDNLQICASRDTPGRELQLPPVVQLAQRYGTVIMARAYAEWNLSTERLAVYKAGIEPAFAPVLRTESDRSGKSLADTVMVAEGMDMLWTLAPEVVVLATSDKDLIPLVRVAKQRGAFVVVLGSDFTAIPLREMADEHVTYRQLITDGTGRITEPGASRQPATLGEPARRRPRDRAVRERPGGAQTTGTPPPARVERESPPVAPTVSSGVSPTTVAPSEPVAPLTAGLAGDADSQIGGRRRRRRGSRRRSDRLGMPGEGTFTSESGALSEGFDPDDMDDAPELEITPTTSDVDVALASSGTIEAPSEPVTEPSEPVTEVEETAEAPVAAPRDRRRRTRRPVVTAESSESEAAPAGGLEAAAPATVEPLAEMLAGGEPIVENGMASITDNGTTSTPTPGEEGEDAAPATRTPRPRRVASASRGRRTR